MPGDDYYHHHHHHHHYQFTKVFENSQKGYLPAKADSKERLTVRKG
jgi:hypothetical protein